MASNFPPAREADLVTFSTNFKDKITATPTTFALTAGQATAYSALHTAFVAAYTTANDPATRSPMNISLKDAAKLALVTNLRLLAGIVQRAPTTTNPMRIELGLPQRFMPSPIPPPGAAPMIEVKSVANRTARLRLIDAASPTRRGRPPGTAGASVFSFVGATPPAEIGDWKLEGNTGRTQVNITFPSSVAAGATVWLCAFWFNPRKQSGPACDPVSANLPGGGVSMLAA